MLRAADLQDVGLLSHHAHLLDGHHFGDDGQASGLAGSGQQIQTLAAQPLEGIRAGARLEHAPAQDVGALLAHVQGGAVDLVFRFDRARAGNDHEAGATDEAASPRDDGVLGMGGAVCESIVFGGARDRRTGRGSTSGRCGGRCLDGRDLGCLGQDGGLGLGGRGFGGIAAEDLQVERLAAQGFERQGGPFFSHVALEVDEEHVLPGTVGSWPRFQLGHAQPVLRQDVQAAEQRALFVSGGKDQAGLARHADIHGNWGAGQRHVAHEDLVLVAHVAVQDVQLVRRRSLGRADGGQGGILGFGHGPHGFPRVEERLRASLRQSRNEG